MVHILCQLGGNGHLNIQNGTAGTVIQFFKGCLGEGVNGNGADKTDLFPLGTHHFHHGFGDTAGNTVCGDNHFGILGAVFLHHHILFPGVVKAERFLIDRLHLVGVPLAGLNPRAVGIIQRMPDAGPLFLALTNGGDLLIAHHLGQFYRLHHGTDHAIRQNEHRIAVPVCQLKRLAGQVNRLLYGGGGQNDHLKAAVTGGLGRLKIILLGRLNGADAGAAAGNIGGPKWTRTTDLTIISRVL